MISTSILISSRRFCSTSSPLLRPVFALYGHCTGYRIGQILQKFTPEQQEHTNNNILTLTTKIGSYSSSTNKQEQSEEAAAADCILEISDVYTPRTHPLHKKYHKFISPSSTSSSFHEHYDSVDSSNEHQQQKNDCYEERTSMMTSKKTKERKSINDHSENENMSSSNQNTNSSSKDIANSRKERSTKMFRGFELDFEEDFEADSNSNNISSSNAASNNNNKINMKTKENIDSHNNSSSENSNETSQSSLSTFTSSTGFAHVIFRVITSTSTSTKSNNNNNKMIKNNESGNKEVNEDDDQQHHEATVGLFSNGAVVSFGCPEEKVRSIIKLFEDCERQDSILFPEGKLLRQNNTNHVPAIEVCQEYSLTTIQDLPDLGFHTPSWFDPALVATTTTGTNSVNDIPQRTETLTNSNINNISHVQETSINSNTKATEDDQDDDSSTPPSSSSASTLPAYVGYFDGGELSSIVLSSTESVEAELPFLHSLAESAEVEFLSIYLDQLASKTQSWRAQLEQIGGSGGGSGSTSTSSSSPSFSSSSSSSLFKRRSPIYFIRFICPLREVRVTYLQALRLSAKIARLKSRSGVFWTERHAPQRVTYECAYDHLEIADRLGILESQVNTVTETVSYLGDELRFDTEFVLEIAIIGLIMTSLMLTLFLVFVKG